MKLLLYCTKAKPYLYDLRNIMGIFGGYNVKQNHLDNLLLNGKIVAECDFEVETLEDYFNNNSVDTFNKESQLWLPELYSYITGNKKATLKDFSNYALKNKKIGYAIHIKNLHIFDEPKNLNETYENVCDKCKIEHYTSCLNCIYNYCDGAVNLTNAPQNMRYCYFKGNKYILISIRPEWLCKILNGEKTIEVRKKVLKEML